MLDQGIRRWWSKGKKKRGGGARWCGEGGALSVQARLSCLYDLGSGKSSTNNLREALLSYRLQPCWLAVG